MSTSPESPPKPEDNVRETDIYCALPHRELNCDANETVILIHGAFDDSSTWDLVIPSLNGYHLLLPDLPSHGIARSLTPFSVTKSARLLRELVTRRAHGGMAKVVGHSLGASVALRLASEYPEVVNDAVFVSGHGTPSPTPSSSPFLPFAVWTSQRVEWMMPRSMIRSLMDGADLPRPDLSLCTVELNRQIFAPTDSKWPSTWPARTLIIAAGKSGILPTQDNSATAQRLAEIGRESNAATLAVTHPNLRHPWNHQEPRLFAAAVDAWFRNSIVLDGFVTAQDESRSTTRQTDQEIIRPKHQGIDDSVRI